MTDTIKHSLYTVSRKIKNLPRRISREVSTIKKRVTPKKVGATLLHITHFKAGSQWINRIFHQCAYDKLSYVELQGTQIITKNILPEKVYPAIYLSYEKFKLLNLPKRWASFIIIRDLRDTLISLYFSLKISHSLSNKAIHHPVLRNTLSNLTLENGLIYLMREGFYNTANIQFSWVNTGYQLLKYEELLANDVEILEPIISKTLLIPKEQVISSILANRFEAFTKGRKPGEENIQSHERKGISGDWKNYFTDKVKEEFKLRFGDLLIQTGYEKDFNW